MASSAFLSSFSIFSRFSRTSLDIGSGSAFLFGLFLLCGGMLRGGRVDTMELYFESAAMIGTLISLGKYLERRSYRKTNAAVKGLVNLIPQEALVWHDGEERAGLPHTITAHGA